MLLSFSGLVEMDFPGLDVNFCVSFSVKGDREYDRDLDLMRDLDFVFVGLDEVPRDGDVELDLDRISLPKDRDLSRFSLERDRGLDLDLDLPRSLLTRLPFDL
eukprot:m.58799 g.58799  ORF g.58799 m.58799 type:complete len:103 (-) comp11200_c0_seq3:1642-1950(-)